MKHLKWIVVALVFFAAGTVAGLFLASAQWHRTMSRFAAIALTEFSVDAHEINNGRADATLERKARAIPSLVEQLHQVHRPYLTEPEFNGALWSVARFYEGIETGFPESIEPIMKSLPPRPLTTCEIVGARVKQPEDNGHVVQVPSGDVLTSPSAE